jgi:glycosyltransferase involved in cell wall biosynthesis
MISYVIPALNEERSIGKVIAGIKEIDKDGEIIVVDSDSTDRTSEISRASGAVVVNEPRRGYGYAYRKGFSVARGEIIVTLDGDGTYPPDEIKRLLDTLSEGYDFVSGGRLSGSSREAISLMHMVGNKILSLLARILFMVNVVDSQSGMWAFRTNILNKIMPSADGMEFSEEIKIRAATEFCYKEVPISYGRRMGEKKLRPWKDGINNLLFLLKLRATSGLRTKHFRCSQSGER